MRKICLLTLTTALLLCVLVVGWSAYAQSRAPVTSVPAKRGWDYIYDTASKAFPTEGDKTKISFYDNAGWELIAVVREENQTVLVFKRPKQNGK
ncbi:MAG: hypothetical protein ACJ73D_10905 [Pyrinomonadaceae bacterium]